MRENQAGEHCSRIGQEPCGSLPSSEPDLCLPTHPAQADDNRLRAPCFVFVVANTLEWTC